MRFGTTTWAIVPLILAVLIGASWQSAVAEDSQRVKTIDRLSRQLGRLKPYGTYKKDADDYFVLGTAELTEASGHADVCFQIKQGQRETAEFLVDYIGQAPPKTLRKWHVFHRLKDDATAEEALEFTRRQYDQLQTYRDDLRRKYQAASIRRC
jgi:hypothetical protein